MTTHQKTLLQTNSSFVRSGDTSEDPKILEDMQCVIHLLNLGQLLSSQMQDVATRICQEVKNITQGRAQLCLGRQRALKRVQLPPSTLATLPVQFGHMMYGTLCIMFDPTDTNQMAIPMPIAQLMAQACSWLFYTLEQSAFVQGQCQQLDYQVNGSLTKREREVLALMCRGHGQDAIAERLCIAPATVSKHRQHIYEQLGVHNERDALFAAYHIGLFSLVE